MAAVSRCNGCGLHFIASGSEDLRARVSVTKAAGRWGGQPLPGGRLAPLFRRAGSRSGVFRDRAGEGAECGTRLPLMPHVRGMARAREADGWTVRKGLRMAAACRCDGCGLRFMASGSDDV